MHEGNKWGCGGVLCFVPHAGHHCSFQLTQILHAWGNFKLIRHLIFGLCVCVGGVVLFLTVVICSKHLGRVQNCWNCNIFLAWIDCIRCLQFIPCLNWLHQVSSVHGITSVANPCPYLCSWWQLYFSSLSILWFKQWDSTPHDDGSGRGVDVLASSRMLLVFIFLQMISKSCQLRAQSWPSQLSQAVSL